MENKRKNKMNEKQTYILLNDKTENKIFKKEGLVWNITNISGIHEKWLDTFNLQIQILKHMNKFIPKIEETKEFHIGFMSIFKENMEFKIKNLFNLLDLM